MGLPVSVSGSAEGRPRSEVERLTSFPRRVLEEVAREAGQEAAEHNVALSRLLDLYLGPAWSSSSVGSSTAFRSH
jgi:hypothetical protein